MIGGVAERGSLDADRGLDLQEEYRLFPAPNQKHGCEIDLFCLLEASVLRNDLEMIYEGEKMTKEKRSLVVGLLLDTQAIRIPSKRELSRGIHNQRDNLFPESYICLMGP